MEESGRLRDEAMAQARQIIEDAANEAAKLITTMNMEREHILADARDDARRIIDEARESTAVDAVPTDVEPTSEVGDRTADEGTTDAVDTTDVADIPPTMTKTDDEWLRDLERLFEDDTTSPRAVPAEPPQRRPRPRWYHH